MTRARLTTAVALLLAVSTSVLAQGKSQQQKKTSPPPSRNGLTAAPVATSTSATPLAWVGDASLLSPGMVALSVSAMRWQGDGVSEVDAPIVDAAFGLAPRVQLSASVPRVVGSADPDGAAGGFGTSFFSAKIAVYQTPRYNFKVATAPALQVLGQGIVESLGADGRRSRWGLPVSAEMSRGATRLYGGGGYFSPGLWFSGVAVGLAVNNRTSASVGVSRAWRSADGPDVVMSARDRKEISWGASFAFAPTISAFGSVARTFATLDENGGGTSISGGFSVFFATAARRP